MSGDVHDFDLTLLQELADACSRQGFAEAFARDSLRDAAIAADRLAAACERQAWDEVRDRAHAIKGIASNIGAIRLARSADRMMQRSDAQMTDAWCDALQQLREALSGALADLDTVLPRIRSRAPHE